MKEMDRLMNYILKTLLPWYVITLLLAECVDKKWGLLAQLMPHKARKVTVQCMFTYNIFSIH